MNFQQFDLNLLVALDALLSGSGRCLVSHVAISTVYAWGLRPGAEIQ